MLRRVYPTLPYEEGRFDYTEQHTYTPDFHLGGNIYVECKEYIQYADVAKYEAIARCNPQLDLRFLVARCDQRTLTRLEKTFVVSISRYIIPNAWFKDAEGTTNDH